MAYLNVALSCKALHPDNANSVHELSKVLDGAYPAAFIEFILDIKNYGLKFVPKLDRNANWNVFAAAIVIMQAIQILIKVFLPIFFMRKICQSVNKVKHRKELYFQAWR